MAFSLWTLQFCVVLSLLCQPEHYRQTTSCSSFGRGQLQSTDMV